MPYQKKYFNVIMKNVNQFVNHDESYVNEDNFVNDESCNNGQNYVMLLMKIMLMIIILIILQ